jgi:hypothetical protein
MIFGFLGRAHDDGCKMICMFFLFGILELRAFGVGIDTMVTFFFNVMYSNAQHTLFKEFHATRMTFSKTQPTK